MNGCSRKNMCLVTSAATRERLLRQAPSALCQVVEEGLVPGTRDGGRWGLVFEFIASCFNQNVGDHAREYFNPRYSAPVKVV